MIEVRSNLIDLARVKHDMLHAIAMIERLKKAGMPIIGILHMRGVERGRLTWHKEEDLDGDVSVMRWFDDNEIDAAPGTAWIKVSSEQHEAWSFTVYRDADAPAPVEDDEL